MSQPFPENKTTNKKKFRLKSNRQKKVVNKFTIFIDFFTITLPYDNTAHSHPHTRTHGRLVNETQTISAIFRFAY